jgi:hypothetical protein
VASASAAAIWLPRWALTWSLLQIDYLEQILKSGRFQGQPDLRLNVRKSNFNATPAQPPAILD